MLRKSSPARVSLCKAMGSGHTPLVMWQLGFLLQPNQFQISAKATFAIWPWPLGASQKVKPSFFLFLFLFLFFWDKHFQDYRKCLSRFLLNERVKSNEHNGNLSCEKKKITWSLISCPEDFSCAKFSETHWNFLTTFWRFPLGISIGKCL